jgi:hypothetical protein
MIFGAHLLLYSDKPELDRAFFRDVLGYPYVDVGHGWLIFKLPRAEAAVHPRDEGEGESESQEEHRMLGAHLYLMCDDLPEQIKQLKAKNVTCTEIAEERWGIRTTIKLPSGGEVGLYQPKHPTALDLT